MTNSDIQALFAARFTMAPGATLVVGPFPGQESVCIKAIDLGASGTLELCGFPGVTNQYGATVPVNGITSGPGFSAGNFFPLDTNPFPMQCRGAMTFIAGGNTVTFAILVGRTKGSWK